MVGVRSKSRAAGVVVAELDGFQERLQAVLKERLPPATDVAKLAEAYLSSVLTHAVERTAGSSVVPSAFGPERASLMYEVSERYGRLVTVDEIKALLRVPVATASSVRKIMDATYVDGAYKLEMSAALVGAKLNGRRSGGEVDKGFAVVFLNPDRLAEFEAALQRRGFVCASDTDPKLPNLLLVDSRVDMSPYQLPKFGKV